MQEYPICLEKPFNTRSKVNIQVNLLLLDERSVSVVVVCNAASREQNLELVELRTRDNSPKADQNCKFPCIQIQVIDNA